eukprot:scaffold1123_cov56-Cylindrotheca_fusiformis.AAC.4
MDPETIIDVSLVHVDAPSHLSAEPLNVLRTREKTKKKKYLKACLQQRRSFVPFVVSTDGLLDGPEAQMFVKKLAADLSIRWDQPKSVVTNFIRARLGIAILRATHHCIRGPRIPASKMSRHIEWTGPAEKTIKTAGYFWHKTPVTEDFFSMCHISQASFRVAKHNFGLRID